MVRETTSKPEGLHISQFHTHVKQYIVLPTPSCNMTFHIFLKTKNNRVLLSVVSINVCDLKTE